jgi:hypothetical protein
MSDYQRLFLDALLERYESKNALVEELTHLLQLGKDAIYRRLRGDTALNMEELFTLAQHFEISLDELNFGGAPKINFTLALANKDLSAPKAFLQSLLDLLKDLRRYKNPKIWCATHELPIFYFALIPEVFTFKIFAWNQVLSPTTPRNLTKFSSTALDPDVLQLCQEINSEYAFLPSEEIWSTSLFDSTLGQIYFHAEQRDFMDIEEARYLCEKMYVLVEHLRRMSAKTAKIRHLGGVPYDIPFHLFYSATLSSNPQYFMESDQSRVVFNSYCFPEFILSKEGRICEYTQEWFRKLRGKSIYLSGNAQASRDAYFEYINKKIKETLEKIDQIPMD